MGLRLAQQTQQRRPEPLAARHPVVFVTCKTPAWATWGRRPLAWQTSCLPAPRAEQISATATWPRCATALRLAQQTQQKRLEPLAARHPVGFVTCKTPVWATWGRRPIVWQTSCLPAPLAEQISAPATWPRCATALRLAQQTQQRRPEPLAARHPVGFVTCKTPVWATWGRRPIVWQTSCLPAPLAERTSATATWRRPARVGLLARPTRLFSSAHPVMARRAAYATPKIPAPARSAPTRAAP